MRPQLPAPGTVSCVGLDPGIDLEADSRLAAAVLLHSIHPGPPQAASAGLRLRSKTERTSVFFHVSHLLFMAMACSGWLPCLQAATTRSLSSSAAASLRGWSWGSCRPGQAARRAACWRTSRSPAGGPQLTAGGWHIC